MHEKNPTIKSGGFVIGPKSIHRKGSMPMSSSPLHEESNSIQDRLFNYEQSGAIVSSGNDDIRYEID